MFIKYPEFKGYQDLLWPPRPTGTFPDPNNYGKYLNITGTMYPASEHIQVQNNLDYDELWKNMYIHAKKVIVPCKYCNSSNAISNSNCVQCGAPMGDSRD